MRIRRSLGVLCLVATLVCMASGTALATETWATDKKTGAKVFWVSNSGSLLTSASWDGPVVEGLAHGNGSFTITVRRDGKDLEGKGQGEMVSGYMQGKIVLQWSHGDSFDGFYRKGLINGKGRYSWSNGNRYDGDWIDGNISGKGLFTWADGKSYEGEWLEGKRNGQGVLKDPQGKVLYDGQWKEDSPVVAGLKTDTVLGIPWGASEKTVKDLMNKRPGTTYWDKGKQKEARRISYFTTYNDHPAIAQVFLYQNQMYWVQVVLQSKTEDEMMKLFETLKQGLSDRYGLTNGEMGTGKEAKARWDLGEDHLVSLRMGKFQTINAAPVFPSVFIDYWYKKTDDIVEKGTQQGNTTDY